jgi:hypothetical protein
MNSTHLPRNWIGFTPGFRKHRQRRRLRHDRWLVFNIAAFNWEDTTIRPRSRKSCCFAATLLNRAAIGGAYKV